MGEMMNRLLERARHFLRAERGNVAMMFGIALVPICIAAGAGLDYARSAVQRQQMADALDAAALAVGSAPGIPSDKIQPLAQQYFDASYSGAKTNGVGPSVVLDNYVANPGSVTIHANYSLDTILLKVIGVTTIPVSTATTVVWGQSKLWVSLVLDNSTSMNEGSGGSTKMSALIAAAKKLVTKLQSVSVTDGDVRVGIVPFTRNVNVDKANASKSWVYWGYWEASPPNATLGTGTDSNGPGAACPFSDNNQGYHCQSSSTNGSSSAATIPAGGLICPSMDTGKVNTDRYNVYYNGCWNSVATRTKVVTTTKTQPENMKQTCKTTGSNPEVCTTVSGYPQNNGNSSTSSATTYTDGYTADSTSSSTVFNNINSQSDGTKSCNGTGSNKVCTWTRTFKQNQVDTTIVKTASDFTHTWQVNDHSTWWGCVMDRPQDYDISNTAPAGAQGFPAANLEMCYNSSAFKAKISPLGYNWSDLATQIGNMTPNGYTNQAIGVAHGWQMLTPGDPWATPAVPANTARYIILFSDGLNTQDRWYITPTAQMDNGNANIDDRLVKTSALKSNGVCDNAKADGIIVYAIYVHLTGDPPDSASMRACATDTSKYFNLTSADQIDAAFTSIGQQITNVRVSR